MLQAGQKLRPAATRINNKSAPQWPALEANCDSGRDAGSPGHFFVTGSSDQSSCDRLSSCYTMIRLHGGFQNMRDLLRAFLFLFIASSFAVAQQGGRTIYLVRHAEKADSPADDP